MNLTSTIKDMFGMEGNISDLRHLFVHSLQDIYYAERTLVDELKEMAEQAKSATLRTAFEDHRVETEEQVNRLEKVFKLLGEEPKEVTCEALDGLTTEAHELLDEAEDNMVDTALVFSAQAVEHYEIARYTALIAWAEKMGQPEVVKLLSLTLKEEHAAANKLESMQSGGKGVPMPKTGTRAVAARAHAKAKPVTKKVAAKKASTGKQSARTKKRA